MRNEPERGSEAQGNCLSQRAGCKDGTIQGVWIESDATTRGKSLHGTDGRRKSDHGRKFGSRLSPLDSVSTVVPFQKIILDV